MIGFGRAKLDLLGGGDFGASDDTVL